MLRTAPPSLLLCGMLLLLLLPGLCRADGTTPNTEVAVDVVPSGNEVANPQQNPSVITVSFRCPAPGHLFLPGQNIDLTAVITSQVAQQAQVTTLVTTQEGIRLSLGSSKIDLPQQQEVACPLKFDGSNELPNGAYKVDVLVAGEDRGFDEKVAAFNVWPGPLDHPVDSFGINYTGPLNTARTWQDLDLFQQAGVGWLRFPLQGWLPQGQATPPEAEIYNSFIQEASKRNFKLLAAFTPRLTVDPSVNELVAGKEYRESLMAAATRYSFKVKDWELLTVKPDPAYKDMKGVRYQDLAKFYSSLKSVDKSLRTIFSVDYPFRWNAQELFNQRLPGKGDVLGFRYDFIGIPESKANKTQPFYALDEVMPNAEASLKSVPPIWTTDYGFDPTKNWWNIQTDRLPDATMQAALISRAIMLNRGVKFERTFWRHDPAEPPILPFTTADGSANAKLLALRTTLQMLDGVTQVEQVPTPSIASAMAPTRIWALLLQKSEGTKRNKKTHFTLAIWMESRDDWSSSALTIKTNVPRFTTTDLWGNTMELQPTSGAAVVPVDAFPRFIDLGQNGDLELLSPFAYFTPASVALTEGGDNKIGLRMHNDQRIFQGTINCDVYLRQWPGDDSDVRKFKYDLNKEDGKEISGSLDIPRGAKKGPLYQVSAEIMLGTRRIGYLTKPVWYFPKIDAPEKTSL